MNPWADSSLALWITSALSIAASVIILYVFFPVPFTKHDGLIVVLYRKLLAYVWPDMFGDKKGDQT